jgi:hypothetical protein
VPARDGIPLPRITEPRASLLPPSEGWGLRLVAGSGTGGLLGQPLQNADVRALLQTQPFRCAGGEPSRLLVRNSLGTCRLSPRASLGSSREAILFSSRGPSQVGRKGVSRNYTFGRRTGFSLFFSSGLSSIQNLASLARMLTRRGFAGPMVAERVHFGAGSTQVIENSMEGKDEKFVLIGPRHNVVSVSY